MFPDELNGLVNADDWSCLDREYLAQESFDILVEGGRGMCGNQRDGCCPRGPRGVRGPRGLQGPMGLPGPVGAMGPMGPAGPVGPQGPVGARGARGARGPTGPQGPIGPAGATGAAGPTGPIGPTGPVNRLGAYGGRYSISHQTLNLEVGGITQIPMASTMPHKSVTYIPRNGVRVAQRGDYEINYFTNLSVTVGTTVTIAVRLNGTAIPGASISQILSAEVGSIINGSIIVNLPAGAVVDMGISALAAVEVTLGSGVNASLSIKKLN